VFEQLPPAFDVERIDVLRAPKEKGRVAAGGCRDTADARTDPQVLAWRGATILVQLESAQEFWVLTDHWQRYGDRALRERSPLLWV
jgi:hypothetical protein